VIGKRISQFNSTEANHSNASGHVGWMSVTAMACCGLLFGCMVAFALAGGGTLSGIRVKTPDQEIARATIHTGPVQTESEIVVASYPGQSAKVLIERSDLDAQFEELRNIEKRVSWKLDLLEETEWHRVGHLVRLYNRMDARLVANLISGFEDATISELLMNLQVRKASEVLSMLSPELAKRVNKQMLTYATATGESNFEHIQRQRNE
jgi:flagellar motility protein MotE (MotC chaperone)